jgi:hypothetical protein
VAQGVEHLHNKRRALSSNAGTSKKQTNQTSKNKNTKTTKQKTIIQLKETLEITCSGCPQMWPTLIPVKTEPPNLVAKDPSAA